MRRISIARSIALITQESIALTFLRALDWTGLLHSPGDPTALHSPDNVHAKTYRHSGGSHPRRAVSSDANDRHTHVRAILSTNEEAALE
jgi:hypothetical protein